MIDTHVHLNKDELGSASALPGVLARAAAAGVASFVVVGFDIPSSERAVALAETDRRLFAAVGVHPHDAESYTAASETRLRELAVHPRAVAIGEVGLDFYRDLSPRADQYRAFRAQLALARDVGLPVVIHCRDAYPETMALLVDEAGDTGIVLHCFAGGEADAEAAFRRGWFLGVGGTVTYKKNEALRAIVRDAPGEHLLLETDAPYLSPEPLRGKYPNEPVRVALVAERVAAIRGETVETVRAYTTANAARAFPRSASFAAKPE